MARYIIEADQEQFTEADIESLEFVLKDLETLEAESTESINLEDVNSKSVAKAPKSWMGAEEAYSYEANVNTPPSVNITGNISSNLSQTANMLSLETFTIIVKLLVPKITSNPRTRDQLQVAVRMGPTAITQLLTPNLAKEVPKLFHWMIPLYLPLVTIALFHPIRKQAGVKPEEVEEAPEVIPLIFGAISALSSGGTFGIAVNKHKKQRRQQKSRGVTRR